MANAQGRTAAAHKDVNPSTPRFIWADRLVYVPVALAVVLLAAVLLLRRMLRPKP